MDQRVLDYIRDRETVTVPGMQLDLQLGYYEAQTIVRQLVAENRLRYDGGVTYTCIAPKEEEQPRKRFSTIEELIAERRRRLSRFSEEVESKSDPEKDKDDEDASDDEEGVRDDSGDDSDEEDDDEVRDDSGDDSEAFDDFGSDFDEDYIDKLAEILDDDFEGDDDSESDDSEDESEDSDDDSEDGDDESESDDSEDSDSGDDDEDDDEDCFNPDEFDLQDYFDIVTAESEERKKAAKEGGWLVQDPDLDGILHRLLNLVPGIPMRRFGVEGAKSEESEDEEAEGEETDRKDDEEGGGEEEQLPQADLADTPEMLQDVLNALHELNIGSFFLQIRPLGSSISLMIAGPDIFNVSPCFELTVENGKVVLSDRGIATTFVKLHYKEHVPPEVYRAIGDIAAPYGVTTDGHRLSIDVPGPKEIFAACMSLYAALFSVMRLDERRLQLIECGREREEILREIVHREDALTREGALQAVKAIVEERMDEGRSAIAALMAREYIFGLSDAAYDEFRTNACGEDRLYPSKDHVRGLAFCILEGKATIGKLLKKFGFTREKSTEIFEWMEESGFIAPFDGHLAREMRITREEFEQQFGPIGRWVEDK